MVTQKMNFADYAASYWSSDDSCRPEVLAAEIEINLNLDDANIVIGCVDQCIGGLSNYLRDRVIYDERVAHDSDVDEKAQVSMLSDARNKVLGFAGATRALLHPMIESLLGDTNVDPKVKIVTCGFIIDKFPSLKGACATSLDLRDDVHLEASLSIPLLFGLYNLLASKVKAELGPQTISTLNGVLCDSRSSPLAKYYSAHALSLALGLAREDSTKLMSALVPTPLRGVPPGAILPAAPSLLSCPSLIASVDSSRFAAATSSPSGAGGMPPPGFVMSPTTTKNYRALSMSLLGSAARPILLQGPSGCGKTMLVNCMAKMTSTTLLPLYLDDQMDSKTLLGTYVCTDTPGEFKWQDGALTTAVTEGHWVLIEDVDKVSDNRGRANLFILCFLSKLTNFPPKSAPLKFWRP